MGGRNGPPTRIRATRIGPPARMATGLSSGVSPAPLRWRNHRPRSPTRPDQRHHLHRHHPHKPGPPISTEHKPPDNTPPDTTNLPSTTQAAPANNAPALNDTDIARAGRNPAPTLASGFPLALNCYPYIEVYTGINLASHMHIHLDAHMHFHKHIKPGQPQRLKPPLGRRKPPIRSATPSRPSAPRSPPPTARCCAHTPTRRRWTPSSG